ncbi:hypothetical protein [Stenotrophomonas sp. SY1]|uniref:hypothetical protein n=1 Tax=Stenotrophomonas sp. SY1 TaxID=477235 RepID=UPI001E4FA0EC|nr:hypothetical protein [Stenotrophomonas sp. SY1]MCD9087391.1 hypothetical protein [Stenotrophomonas sp. SY1]
MNGPSNLGFTIENRSGVDVLVFANDSCRPAMETEVAMWQRLNAASKHITHVVVADTDEFGTVACGYSGTPNDIARAVMAKACGQGYTGTYEARMEELGWRVAPVFLVPAAGASLAANWPADRDPVGTIIEHTDAAPSFQDSVGAWMAECFFPSLYSNMTERGDRLLEEVLELLQAHGYDRARVPTLVNYVFGRPIGQPAQEVGGVMVTLAAYCWVAGLDMHSAGDVELARINQPAVMAKIRAKQESKNALHFDTPLPGPSPAAPGLDLTTAEVDVIEALLALAYAAWNAADNGEDNGESLTIERSEFAAVGKALDTLDELPDDRPGEVMEAAAKARWALRRVLSAPLADASPKGGSDAPTRDHIDADNGLRSYPWTYQNQPGNLGASALGDCARLAHPGGDSIDHGLSLLRELHVRGFGIVRVAKLATGAEVKS